MTQTSSPRLLADAVRDTIGKPAEINLGGKPMVFAVLLVLLLVLFALRIAIGSVNIPLNDILSVLLGGEASKATWANIILNIRLPRALTAVLAGAALSVGGLMMQTLFRNPLAGPDVLGVSSGASLGVALMVLGTGAVGTTLLAGVGLLGDMSIAAAACAGAGAAMLLVALLARQVRSGTTLLILGLMLAFFTSAIVSLLLYFSIPEQIQAYINWTFGSFDGVAWGQMGILAVGVLVGLGLAFALAKALNALLLGEAYARSMGVNVRRARQWIILATALLTGLVTAFCGPIGFVGIAVPHLCRGLFNTSDHRILLPASAMMGAIVAMFAAMVAQVPGSQMILPLNPIMALLGAPVVIGVIVRQRSATRLFET